MGMSAGQTGGRGSRGHRRRGRHHGLMSEINVTPFVLDQSALKLPPIK